jgi:F-type H+-transporting ATPase subunit epsilon
MLPDSLQLEVVTPERQLIAESVSEVQLPAQGGYLGILPGHAPLITELGMGELSYRRGGETYYATVIHGFAEVLPDRVIVLAERAERAEEVDVKRAHAARERAEKLLAQREAAEIDWDRATFALQRSLIRLQVAAKGGVVAAQGEQHPAP